MNNKIIEFLKKPSIRLILPIIGILFIIVSSILLLWHGNANSNQSFPAYTASVYFEGQYRINDGEWQEIVDGEHISSTQGDVTLRGNFHMLAPNGEYVGVYREEIPIAFYLDHISLTFYEVGSEPFMLDMENPIYGNSICGVNWEAYNLTSERDHLIEILIHNPHNYGNENAIDEMLSKLTLWTPIEFEKGVLDSGATQRNIGLAIIIASVMFLGTALFSSLIHVKNSKFIWLLGLVILFAGIYFTYSSFGISFWSESIVFNTSILGISMMLYTLFLSMLITTSFKKTKKVGVVTCLILGIVNTIFFILPMITKVLFYDTWRYWSIIQSVANVALIICTINELIHVKGKNKLIYIGAFLPLVAFSVDALATLLGLWQGGITSQYVFMILFIVAIVILLRIIPNSINAIAKTKELENEKLALNAELTESRVSTMMSQIRPHFIYNTLGSIEQLCELDPPKAGELVHNFAKYLRGNFGELDNPKPILMSQEMEHVRHYINIENVRFPDMTFSFEMNSNDFRVPALTIQPIVENAIKHGLMKLSKGGTIKVVSYETDDNYCVTVEDDGVGFDTNVLLDEGKHVGIRNIRGRLKAMVNGTLEIESKIGVGTKVLITIPKEEQKCLQ
jgi:sensor histidine kinase YesM